jgi:L-seryl-tRNA(Ser) seleniumtransferase
MAKGGAVLCEVGTTNRTHPRDYENAIDGETGLLLKAHTSNFAMIGFTSSVTLEELCGIGRAHGIPVMEDLGSGSLLDLSGYGLPKEPVVGDSVAAGTDLVTFSGDKMLGGPQAGIIVGKKDIVDECRRNPLARALRIDKLTLAALESTLRLYRDPDKARTAIPTLILLTAPEDVLMRRARRLSALIGKIPGGLVSARVMKAGSKVGGGALPLADLPSFGVAVGVSGLSPNALEKAMRKARVPVIGRIENDSYFLDVRTIQDVELSIVIDALSTIASNLSSEALQ